VIKFWTLNPTEIKLLSKCFSLSEILIFENYTVHQSLFPHILWTGKENIAKKVGLYVKTLELPPPARVAFKIMRHWPVARLMGKLGMGKSVASQNAKIYSASSAIGLITTASNTPYDFIHVGRFLQRLWLTADSIGLCMQPLAGLVYIGHRIDEGDTEQFTPVQIELIREGYRRISEIFSVRPQSMALPFRIGYGGEPTSRSLHLSPRFL
jgi:hypothetical protein